MLEKKVWGTVSILVHSRGGLRSVVSAGHLISSHPTFCESCLHWSCFVHRGIAMPQVRVSYFLRWEIVALQYIKTSYTIIEF